MKPCKHLDYAGEYTDCVIKTCAPHFSDVRYWERGETWTDDGANPRNVQFCKLRGRINQIFGCYNGELGCYEPEGENGPVSQCSLCEGSGFINNPQDERLQEVCPQCNGTGP